MDAEITSMPAYREDFRERPHFQLTGLRAKTVAMRSLLMLVCVLAVAPRPGLVQQYAIGADVSFLAKCEQDGVVFKENGQPKDVLDRFCASTTTTGSGCASSTIPR